MRWVCPLAVISLTAVQSTSLSASASSTPTLPLGRDWALTIRGDFRPRLETWRSGASDPDGSGWDALVSQRARLGSELVHRNGIALDLALQDVRDWGASGAPGANVLEVHTANLKLPMTEQLTLVIGRQELAVGHDRVLGNDDYQQRGRSFDGLRLTLTAPPTEAHLFYAKLREGTIEWSPRRRTATLGDHDIGGVVDRTALVANHFASVLFLVDGDRENESTRYTFGGILGGYQSVVRYWAEAYGQSGVEHHEVVRAYFVGARAELASQRRFAPKLALWLDHASGNGSRRGAFDVPLGSSHEYLGALDLFVDLPEDTGSGGITDFGAGACARPYPALQVSADWHHFSTQRHGTDAGSGLLGQEVDLQASLEIADFVTLDGLAAAFFPNDTYAKLRTPGGTGSARTELGGYVSLRARF